MTIIIARRKLLAAFGGAAAWPLAARAQQTAPPRTIGILGSGTPASQGERYTAFAERLRDLGWIEKRNVTFEYRWAEGRTERFAEIAAEFVRLKVDVIVTHSVGPVIAAKQATSIIPIVFAAVGDPVATGLVANLARPGDNVTGLSVQQSDIAGKRLELLREVVPVLRRLANGGVGCCPLLLGMQKPRILRSPAPQSRDMPRFSGGRMDRVCHRQAF